MCKTQPAYAREVLYSRLASDGKTDPQAFVEDLQNKLNDLLELEQNAVELAELFFFVSVLIEEQSERLDSIEERVLSARTYAGHALQELKQAQEYKKAQLNKKLIFGVVLGILIIIPVAPVIGILL